MSYVPRPAAIFDPEYWAQYYDDSGPTTSRLFPKIPAAFRSPVANRTPVPWHYAVKGGRQKGADFDRA